MRRILYIALAAFAICSCGQSVTKDPTLWITDEELASRNALDFTRDSADVVEYLLKYYPDLTAEQVAAWESNNALENMMIDGQKRYFRNGPRNLFRIDPAAREVYYAAEPQYVAEDKEECMAKDDYCRSVVAAARATGKNLLMPKKFTVLFEIKVKPDVVPAGETVRAWIPFPREDQNSITDVKLLETSEKEYILSPDEASVHKSVYMEKKAVAGEPTVFTSKFTFTTYAEWYDLKAEDIKPYDTQSALYKEYTAERERHVIFTDRIRAITDSLVGSETNPYLKVRSIYSWIVANYPWASAREYSTIENIPMYVLANNHGDCGQVGLLLITMCRYAGVPARWQSGFEMADDSAGMHDWAEIYYEGIGWVPTDVSFGRGRTNAKDEEDVFMFYTRGLDAYRWIANSDFGGKFYPEKKFIRSETVDFQRGEVEWAGGNLYYMNQWSGWPIEVTSENLY